MNVSLILGCYNRPTLLDKSLSSIANQKITSTLEVVVVNDGLKDDTEAVCVKYKDRLDIRYIFSGQRNVNGLVRRMAGFALNIGVKQCKYNNIILSCAEIYHINNAIDETAKFRDYYSLVTPRFMYYDDLGSFTQRLINAKFLPINIDSVMNVTMPYFMGMRKALFVGIGGYDEDFIGYAGEDNDLMGRLIAMGCEYYYTDARIVHLFHGARCDSQEHPENPQWAYNYILLTSRKGIIVRNQGREWGVIK